LEDLLSSNGTVKGVSFSKLKPFVRTWRKYFWMRKQNIAMRKISMWARAQLKIHEEVAKKSLRKQRLLIYFNAEYQEELMEHALLAASRDTWVSRRQYLRVGLDFAYSHY
jgi:hypothetical protein